MSQKSTFDRAQLLPLRLIWIALTTAILILVFIVHSVAQTSPDGASQGDALGSIFPIVSVVILGVSCAIRNLGAGSSQRNATQNTSSQEAIGRFLPRLLIRCALHEAVAILGFVLAILSQTPAAIYPYAAAAIVANLFIFPSASRIGA